MSKAPSWESLRQRPRPDAVADEYAELCAAAFTTPAGKRLLAYLHSRYINAVLPGNPDSCALLALNAKRQIVRELEEQTERGLALLKKETTA